MPKVKKSKGGGGEKSGAGAAVALADQILQADTIRARGRVKGRDVRSETEDQYVDERLSRKILQQARIQQEELQTEYGLAPQKKKAPVTVLGKVVETFMIYFNRLTSYWKKHTYRKVCFTVVFFFLCGKNVLIYMHMQQSGSLLFLMDTFSLHL